MAMQHPRGKIQKSRVEYSYARSESGKPGDRNGRLLVCVCVPNKIQSALTIEGRLDASLSLSAYNMHQGKAAFIALAQRSYKRKNYPDKNKQQGRV